MARCSETTDDNFPQPDAHLMTPIERPLTTAQRLVHFAHGALDGEGMPVFACRITGPWDEARFGVALAGLQQGHPLLRSRIVESQPSRPMLQLDPNPPAIPVTVEAASTEHCWEQAALDCCRRPVAADRAPLCRVVVLPNDSGESFDVIFAMHHAIVDGISFIALIRELIERLAGRTGPSGVEGVEFDPPARIATTRWERWRAIAQLFRTRWKHRKDRISLIREEIASPGSIVRQVWPAELTSAVISKCRTEQTTILGAALAAAMQTLAEDQNWGDATQQIHVPVNLRKSLVPPIPDEALGCFVSRINLWQTAPASQSLWNLARRCRQEIQRELDDRIPIPRDEFLGKLRLRPSMLQNVQKATLCINNLGTWNSDDASPWRLAEFSWFGYSRALGTNISLYLITIDGCLNLTWQSDCASRETLIRLGEKLTARLEQEVAAQSLVCVP